MAVRSSLIKDRLYTHIYPGRLDYRLLHVCDILMLSYVNVLELHSGCALLFLTVSRLRL